MGRDRTETVLIAVLALCTLAQAVCVVWMIIEM